MKTFLTATFVTLTWVFPLHASWDPVKDFEKARRRVNRAAERTVRDLTGASQRQKNEGKKREQNEQEVKKAKRKCEAQRNQTIRSLQEELDFNQKIQQTILLQLKSPRQRLDLENEMNAINFVIQQIEEETSTYSNFLLVSFNYLSRLDIDSIDLTWSDYLSLIQIGLEEMRIEDTRVIDMAEAIYRLGGADLIHAFASVPFSETASFGDVKKRYFQLFEIQSSLNLILRGDSLKLILDNANLRINTLKETVSKLRGEKC